ncbi:MAG: hypothetical protein GY847_16390 [Proteobacteria bacterium]|nr:hypothetical protein [Pseudomonadota bacterium]
MVFIKRVFVVLPVFAALAACGGSPAPKSGAAAHKASTVYESVDIPLKIARDDRSIWVKRLYLLPAGHPNRLQLRDRLVQELSKDFSNISEDNVENRLALFEEVLALHDSTDFKPGRVSPDAVPMAEWIVRAFERRGDEAVVLAGLRFLMMAKPDDVRLKERYLELADWSESVRATIYGRLNRLNSLIDMYRSMIQLVPDREIVEHLAEMYIVRYRLILTVFRKESGNDYQKMHPLDVLRQGQFLQSLPIDVIYIFFLVGDPAGARKHLAGLAAEGKLHVEYLELLDRIFQGRDIADSYFSLARHLAPIDARASLRACISARAADSEDPRFSVCIGRRFEELDQPECAFDFYVEAARVSSQEDVFANVLKLLRQTLLKVHTKELVGSSQRAIEMGDALIDQALKLFPNDESELKMIIASLLYTFGEVEFDNGNIESSRHHLNRSFEVMANVLALVKLTEVHYLLGEFTSGVEILDRALALELEGRRPSGFWQAIMLEKRGDLMAALGRQIEAEKFYRKALSQWGSTGIEAGQKSLAAVRRGVIFDRLRDLPASQDAFRQAIRLDPDRQGIYAQLISFLVIRGRLEDAKEFYKLAYNQDQIEAMWKIYYSLWLEGLSQRAGKGSFDLAKGYLEHSRGETWQDQLAKFYSGEKTVEVLHQEAANAGQHVEVEYYAALIDLAQGRKNEARTRLEKVVASKLLGFFEYRMARAILYEELGKKTGLSD